MSKPKSTKKPLRKSTGQRQVVTGVIIPLVAILAIFGTYEAGRHNHLWGDPDELRAIKSEKLAGPDLLGLELIDTVEMGAGSLVSKTVSPSVSRTFDLGDRSYDEVQSDIIDISQNNGWAYDPSMGGQNSWWARKTVNGHKLSLEIRKPISPGNSIEVTVL